MFSTNLPDLAGSIFTNEIPYIYSGLPAENLQPGKALQKPPSLILCDCKEKIIGVSDVNIDILFMKPVLKYDLCQREYPIL